MAFIKATSWLLTVACPACGAEPGQSCMTKSGKPAREAHDGRRTAAAATLDDEEDEVDG